MSETHKPRRPRRDLRDSYTFWLSVAGVLLTLGGGAMGVTATIAVPEQLSVWSSGWFIFGSAVAGLGVILILWALGLYARSGHWAAAAGDTINAPTAIEDRASMRATLREIRPDLQESLSRLIKAQKTGRFWNSEAGPLPDYGWNRNKQKLSVLPNIGFLYDDLDLAFGEIKQINTLYTARARGRGTLHLIRILDRNLIRSQDDLTTAIVAVQGAIKAVERQLYDLD